MSKSQARRVAGRADRPVRRRPDPHLHPLPGACRPGHQLEPGRDRADGAVRAPLLARRARGSRRSRSRRTASTRRSRARRTRRSRASRDDIERRFVFNTPIAAVMELVNELSKAPDDPAARFAAETAVSMLQPYAPHVCEELWGVLGKSRLWDSPWPVADESLLVRDEVELVLQVNGKVRDRVRVPGGPVRGRADRAGARVREGAGAPERRVRAARDRGAGQARQHRRLSFSSFGTKPFPTRDTFPGSLAGWTRFRSRSRRGASWRQGCSCSPSSSLGVRHLRQGGHVAALAVAPIRVAFRDLGASARGAGRRRRRRRRRPPAGARPPSQRARGSPTRSRAPAGTTRLADRSGVNLAAPVSDGQQVLVPRRGVRVERAGGDGRGRDRARARRSRSRAPLPSSSMRCPASAPSRRRRSSTTARSTARSIPWTSSTRSPASARPDLPTCAGWSCRDPRAAGARRRRRVCDRARGERCRPHARSGAPSRSEPVSSRCVLAPAGWGRPALLAALALAGAWWWGSTRLDQLDRSALAPRDRHGRPVRRRHDRRSAARRLRAQADGAGAR